MKKLIGITALIALAATGAAAQHEHHAGGQAPVSSTEKAHHEFLAQERAAIERGEGFGMAMAADRNGYAGPKHALELREQLKLSAEQVAAMEKLRAAMLEQALAKGRELLAAEEQLEKMFREGRSESELQAQTLRIGTLRAEVRWVHLRTHLAAEKVLTADQKAAYQKLRHGSGEHAH